MNNQIQLVLKSSTAEMPLNDHELGIYLVPELDGLVGLPEIRTTSGVNAGYDGGWTSAQNYDARSITIRGVIANQDVATVERLRKQLVSLAGQGKKEELTLDLVTEAGNAYTLQVRTIALDMAMKSVLEKQEFMLQLRADDPLIYDASESAHEAFIQVSKATGGFLIDFELPLAITGGSDEAVVENNGFEQVPTTTKMYGALHNPKLVNQTTNQFMQIEADLGFSEGQWVDPSEPVEGENITINGAPADAPLSSFSMAGNTTQQTYTGKNYLNIKAPTYNTRGTTTTVNTKTGEMSFSGTTTAGYPWLLDTTASIPAGSYVISIDHTLSYQIVFRFYYDGSNYTEGGVNAGSTTRTITLPNDTIRIVALYNVQSGVDIGSNKVKPMVVAGSTPGDFEPYVGGKASPNPDYPQAVQTTTGYNKVKICGKNVLNYGPYLRASSSGLTFTYNSDGTLTIANTSTSTWHNVTSAFDAYLPAGNYTFSIDHALTFTVYLQCWYQDGTTTNLTISAGNTSANTTFTSDVKQVQLVFASMTGGQAYNDTIKLQLEKGPATNFEPYQGQSYEVNLGKNLFDISVANMTVARLNSSGNITTGVTNRLCTAGYIEVSPSTTYTLNALPETSGKTLQAYIVGYSQSGSETAIGNYPTNAWYGFPITFTTGSNCRFIRISYHYSDDSTMATTSATNQQLEMGSQATSYSDYFTPIELCKVGNYQDYIYKDGDDWKIHKEIGSYTFDGSEPVWSRSGSSTPSVFVAATGILLGNYIQIKFGEGPSTLSDSFVFSTNQGGAGGRFNLYNGTTYYQSLAISFDATAIADITAAKAWLASNTPTFYGVLATPTDTVITNEALVAQLEELLNNARMYNPQTNISSQFAIGNAQGELAVSYYTNKTPDIRDELIIDSRLRTITLNGVDVYHLKTAGSEFIMLAPGENRLSLESDIPGDNGYAQVSYKQGYLSI